MVKFSKELESQLIPEWKEAFVNYWLLKKMVKKIKIIRKAAKQYSSDGPRYDQYSVGGSISDQIRHLAARISDRLWCSGSQSPHHRDQSSSKHYDEGNQHEEDSEAEANEEEEEEEDHEVLEGTESELVQLFSEEDAVNRFFDQLDRELEKVNGFYMCRERELVERGEALNKQLQVLLELKRILSERGGRGSMISAAQSPEVASPRSSLSSVARSFDIVSTENVPGTLHRNSAAATANFEIMSSLSQLEIKNVDNASFVAATVGGSSSPHGVMSHRSHSNSNNNNIINKKFDNTKTSNSSTNYNNNNNNASVRRISAAMAMIWEDIVVKNPRRPDVGMGTTDVVNRKKVQCAEKMIRSAYVELYRGLGLLKTYSSLNMVAFTKILKKFDKVANRNESPTYLQLVKESYFISSDKVVRELYEVESLFTQHFAENDRKKAMKFLRPQQHKGSHMLTFLVGLFTGCFVTLFLVYAILAHMSGIFSPQNKANYVEAVYPVCSILALLSLHVFMYGCNLFMWKATRINHNFIFEFSPKTALKHRDAFLICTSLMTAVVTAMVVHLLLKSSGLPPTQVDTLPWVLLLVFVGLLICPLDIFYRPTRLCFLRVMRNILCSPFYKVTLVDFFMADQLCSQIPLLRHVETAGCYFLAGNFRTHHYETCRSGKLYRQLAYVVSFAPYYWRAMQCGRRWFDESDPSHLYNLGKYLSAMVAAGVRLRYVQDPDSVVWLVAVVVTSAAATVYQLYWDFVRDWGFFNSSNNPWLRDNLVLKNKCVYYVSILVNVVLRVVWVESVMKFRVGFVQSRMLDFFLASLEVIRRGHWNFYRLENEHLNNVGEFRALKTVPLPFSETESDR